jgi:hypothetical protein
MFGRSYMGRLVYFDGIVLSFNAQTLHNYRLTHPAHKPELRTVKEYFQNGNDICIS